MAKSDFIVDMQAHFIPPEAVKLVSKTDEYDYTIGLKRFKKAYELIQDVDSYLKWMDDAGIDVSVLSTASFCNNGPDFCKATNDGYAKVIKDHPDRFRAMIHVYPFDIDKLKTEVKRGVEELGLWGIGVASSYANKTIDEPWMNPIYEAAVEYKMPLYVHPSIRVDMWGAGKYDLHLTVSREYEVVKSFVEMIYGVVPRYPDLQVIYAHFGGGLPALKGRLLSWHRPPGFPIPEQEQGHGYFIEQAEELGLVAEYESRVKNFIFDSAGYGGWMPIHKAALEALGADHLCFGTDYPYEVREARYVRTVLENVKKLGLPDADREKFLSGNLKKMFKIG
jgi:predicted TIM-barrel fold metal-dependent hydrolase